MPTLSPFSRLASPVDTVTYGEYRITRRPDGPRPLYRFAERISEDNRAGSTPRVGRYHLYAHPDGEDRGQQPGRRQECRGQAQ